MRLPAAEDNKSNSDKVPGVYAIPGQFDRVVTLRFKFDTGTQWFFPEWVPFYHIHQVSNRAGPSFPRTSGARHAGVHFVVVTIGVMDDGIDFLRIDDKTYR